MYRCIVADPPWRVTRGPVFFEGGRSQPLPYPTMSVGEIAALPVGDVVGDAAHLYLWTINRYVDAAYDVARAWGFRPSTLLVWAKPVRPGGLGGAWKLTTEFCLFARRGVLPATGWVNSTWFGWKRGRHSEKPEEFQDLVERVSPGPYLELFARRRRPGWHVWGNEVECDVALGQGMPSAR